LRAAAGDVFKIAGFDGAYHRFTGKVTIEKFEKDVRVEIFDDHAIWELMYFGKTRGSHESAHMPHSYIALPGSGSKYPAAEPGL
jgi:hypothetical protein